MGAPALLLPLPFYGQLAYGLLALRSLLPRMHAVAAAHAAARGAAQCHRAVAGMRLAMQAVAPGSPLSLPQPPPAQACWLLHTWVVLCLGFCLPTAVGYAFHRHAHHQQQHHHHHHHHHHQQQQQQRQQQQPAGDPSQAGTATGCGSPHSPTPEAWEPIADATSDPAEVAEGHQAPSPILSASPSSLSPGSRLAALLPPARTPSVRSVGSSGSLAALRGGRSLPSRVPDQPPTGCTAELARCLVLMLPVWATVWAGLELLVQAGW